MKIFLSETQIDQETVEDLLCPDRIDAADFKSHLDKKLNKHELDLFYKWYKPVDVDSGSGYYRLELDFTSSHGQKSLAEDLNKLCRLLYTHFEDPGDVDEPLSHSSLRLKYLKSVQQDELEMISHSVADPNMIVWVHLVGDGGHTDRLNKARYAAMFDLLKVKVLNHNYKQIRAGDTSALLTQHLDSINEFLFNSIKLLVDSITADLDKSSISVFSLSEFYRILAALMILIISPVVYVKKNEKN